MAHRHSFATNKRKNMKQKIKHNENLKATRPNIVFLYCDSQ